MKRILLTAFAGLLLLQTQAQFNQPWQGKKCAVVLTYDDAIDQHLDNVVPVLDSLGLKATFYITAFSHSLQTRLNEWKNLATKGYELGNHTLYHPCNGGKGREWVRPEYDLTKYTVQRMIDETRMTNLFLQALDGKTKRTFAFPCADTKIHDTAYIDSISSEFVAVRNVRSEMLPVDKVDLADVGCYMINGETGEQMIELVSQAMKKHALIVFLFHGVQGGNSLNVSLAAHSKLLHFLKQNEKDVWTAPMLEVAKYIKKCQSK